MRTGMRSLSGQTAIVTGGGTSIGRAIALALSARGVRIVVTGRDEKGLGETVGEIAHGGGKARHLAGDQADVAHVVAVVDRAIEVFAAPTIAVIADVTGAESAVSELARRVAPGGRVLLAFVAPAGDATSFVGEMARAVAARGITCNALLAPASAEEEAADDMAELAVFLCSDAGARITGQSIVVGHAVRTRSRDEPAP